MSHSAVFKRPRSRQTLRCAILLAAGLSVLGTDPARALAADGDPATSDLFQGGIVIPYEGSLMADGQEMSGVVSMRFTLQNGSSVRYAETHEEVTLYNGRFAVRLGTGTDTFGHFTDVIVDGDRLVLSIALRDDAGTFVSLEGRQSIEPVAYAAWTAHAARLAVAGSLTVSGEVSAPVGAIEASSLTATGQVRGAQVSTTQGGITAQGTVSATLDVTTNANLQASADVTAGGAVTAASVTANEIFGGSTSITGHAETRDLTVGFPAQLGPVRVSSGLGSATDVTSAERLHFRLLTANRPLEVVGGDVDVVGGNIRTTGDVIADSNGRANCTWTGWLERTTHFSGNAPSTADSASYNRRECGGGQFVAAMDFNHVSGQNSTHNETYRIFCCDL